MGMGSRGIIIVSREWSFIKFKMGFLGFLGCMFGN
jgi:hypothetical protein